MRVTSPSAIMITDDRLQNGAARTSPKLGRKLISTPEEFRTHGQAIKVEKVALGVAPTSTMGAGAGLQAGSEVGA